MFRKLLVVGLLACAARAEAQWPFPVITPGQPSYGYYYGGYSPYYVRPVGYSGYYNGYASRGCSYPANDPFAQWDRLDAIEASRRLSNSIDRLRLEIQTTTPRGQGGFR